MSLNSIEYKYVGYVIHSSIFEDGIIFNIISDTEYRCFYDKKYPLVKGDKVIANGSYGKINLHGKETSIFICDNVTARYPRDIKAFLANYFPKITNDQLDDLTSRFMEYADMCNRSVIASFGDLSDRFAKDKELEEISNAGVFLFPFLKEEDAISLLKNFLLRWKNECCIRPLELMGIEKDIINKIRIPLYDAIDIVEVNPFRIPEIPFEVAERIFSQHLREEPSREQMICGKINRFVLQKLEISKWSSVPFGIIRKNFKSFDSFIEILCQDYFCTHEFDSLYLKYIHKIEESVAYKITKLLNEEPQNKPDIIFLDKIPTEEQQIAIQNSLSNSITLIPGTAGTGKSTIETHIIRNASRLGKKIICLGFTGKSVMRIRDLVRKDGIESMCNIMTIDMAIASSNVEFNIAIIDEISMVSTELFFRFIRKYCRLPYSLILIGDNNQLHPIAWGNFMGQLLQTTVPRYSLTHNFRSQSMILKICNSIIDKERIKNQEFVQWNQNSEDYRFFNGNLKRIEDLLKEFQRDNKSEESMTLISPFRMAVADLNILFQSLFRNGDCVIIDNRKWYLNDRIMCLQNNYGLNVMNGENGIVNFIDDDYITVIFRDEIIVPFLSRKTLFNLRKIGKDLREGRKIEESKDFMLYEKLTKEFTFLDPNFNTDFYVVDVETITHSYCLTVHKSQGSEYENVIFYLPDNKSTFLNLNLLYTGLSRTKEHLDVVVEDTSILNNCSLRYPHWTSENLGLKINKLCGVEVDTFTIANIEETEDYFNEDDF